VQLPVATVGQWAYLDYLGFDHLRFQPSRGSGLNWPMALDGLAKRLGLNLPAPRGAANDNNPELAHDAGAAKGPFWALFESVYVGRSVRHADGRRGLVAFGPYQVSCDASTCNPKALACNSLLIQT
jgi:hypothetical protein